MNEARIKELEEKLAQLTREGHTATGKERKVLNRYKAEAAQQINEARRED